MAVVVVAVAGSVLVAIGGAGESPTASITAVQQKQQQRP